MKLFSKQLSTIYKNQEALSSVSEDSWEYPKLEQFLLVVGIDSDSTEVYHSIYCPYTTITTKLQYSL